MQIRVNNVTDSKIILRENRFQTISLVQGKLVLIDWIVDNLEEIRKFYKDVITSKGLPIVKPIIISETEKIGVGDKFLFQDKHIETAGPDGIKNYYELENDYGKIYKILALPEHFSPEQLQMIVDGKVKDGDRVLVKCKEHRPFIPPNKGFDHFYAIELTPYVHIYLIEEKMYTREEVRKLTKDAWVQGYYNPTIPEFEDWFDKNVK